MKYETKWKILNNITFKCLRKIFWDNILVRLVSNRIGTLQYLKIYSLWQRLERLNVNNPSTYTDKLQWIKLHVRDSNMTRCADKYLVRDYIVEKLGNEGDVILNEIYGVYSNVDEIDLATLPNSFVLKANHGSGWNIIVPNKKAFGWNKAKHKMGKWLKQNYYYKGREWQYKEIPPRITCEKFLKNADGSEIRDYKFMCFNGKVNSVWVDYDRHTNHVRNFYNLDGTPQYYESDEPSNYSIQFVKPQNYDKMIDIATKLCQDFNHVRVDLYNIDGKIYFGEMTFTPWGGMSLFKTKELNKYWGKMLDLHSCQKFEL